MIPHWWVLRLSLHFLSVGNSAPAILSPSCPSGPTCSATVGRKKHWLLSGKGCTTIGASIKMLHHNIRYLHLGEFCMSPRQTIWVCAFRPELSNGSCIKYKQVPHVNWLDSKQKVVTYGNDPLRKIWDIHPSPHVSLDYLVSFWQWGDWPPA